MIVLDANILIRVASGFMHPKLSMPTRRSMRVLRNSLNCPSRDC
jgi:hypothetical protein